MGFQQEQSTKDNNFEKAVGFINITMSDAEGNSFKVGSLPLKASSEVQKFIHDTLSGDPEKLAKIINQLEFNYQPAVRKAAGFKIV